MSSSVDHRVVEMDFDNAKFKQGVASTIAALQQLDSKLQLSKGANGFERIQNAAKNLTLSGAKTAIAGLQSGFVSFGEMAHSVLDGISNKLSSIGNVAGLTLKGFTAAVTGIALHGGIKRAMDVKQARFLLQGLLQDADQVENVLAITKDAVKGTAAGFGEAALVAAQLAAAGVTSQEQLGGVIKGIAGVSAMSGRAFSDVGRIFTKVSGQGRLMGEELMSMSAMGINAAQQMAKLWGKSEAEVRDMVSKGQVTFEMFADAMNTLYGEHAKKANETFTGALANTKAALSRVVEGFADPSIDRFREILVELIPLIDHFTATLGPLKEMYTDVTKGMTESIIGAIRNVDENMPGIMTRAIELFTGGFNVLGSTAGKFFEHFTHQFKFVDFFGELGSNLDKMSVSIPSAVTHIFTAISDGFFKGLPGQMELERWLNTFQKFPEMLAKGAESLSMIFKPLKAENIARGDYDVLGSLSNIFERLSSGITYFMTIFHGVVDAVFSVMGPALDYVISLLPKGIKWFDDLTASFGKGLPPASSLANAIRDIGEKLGNFFTLLKNGKTPLEAFKKVFKDITGLKFDDTSFGTMLSSLSDFATKHFSGDIFASFGDFLGKVMHYDGPIENVGDFINSLLNAVSSLGGSVLSGIPEVLNALGNGFKSVGDGIGKFIANADPKKLVDFTAALATIGGMTKLGKFIDQFGDFESLGDIIRNGLGGLTSAVVEPFTNALESVTSALSTWQSSLKVEQIRNIAISIGIVAGSLFLLSTADPAGLAVGLLAIAATMLILYEVMESFNDMATIDNPKKGVLGFLEGFKKEAAETAKLVALAHVLKSMAQAVLMLSVAMRILGTMKVEDLAKGGIAIIGMITMLTIAMNSLAPASKALAKTAPVLVAFSGAIIAMSLALKILSTIPMDNMLTALTGFAGGVMVLAVALYLLADGKFLAGAAALLVASVALLALVPALVLLSSLNLMQVGTALIALAGAMLILGVASLAMQEVALGAVALIAVAAAVAILAPALVLLSTIPLEGLGVALLALAGTLLVLGVAAVALAPAIIPMLGLGAALVLLGAGIAVASVGITTLVTALLALAAGGSAAINVLVEGIKALALALIGLIPTLVEAIVGGIVQLAVSIASNASILVEAGVQLIISLLQGIIQYVPQIATYGLTIIVMFAQAISQGIPILINVGMQMIINFVNGLAMTIHTQHQAMYEAGKNLFMAILEAAADTLGSMIGDIGSFIMDIPAYISGEKSLFEGTGEELGSGVKEGAESGLSELPEVGTAKVEEMMTSMSTAASTSDGMFEGLGTALTGQLEGLDLGSIGTAKFEELITSFSNTGEMESSMTALGDSGVQALDQSLSRAPEIATQKSNETAANLGSGASAAYNAGSSVGQNFGSGMQAGIAQMASAVAAQAAAMVSQAKAAAQAAQNSKSPSKDTEKFGVWFGEGYAIGIRSMAATVTKAASGIVSAAEGAIESGKLSGIIDGVSSERTMVLHPVWDLADYEGGIRTMNRLYPAADSFQASFVGMNSDRYARRLQGSTYNIALNYTNDADANRIFSDLTNEIRSKNLMEA